MCCCEWLEGQVRCLLSGCEPTPSLHGYQRRQLWESEHLHRVHKVSCCAGPDRCLPAAGRCTRGACALAAAALRAGHIRAALAGEVRTMHALCMPVAAGLCCLT